MTYKGHFDALLNWFLKFKQQQQQQHAHNTHNIYLISAN